MSLPCDGAEPTVAPHQAAMGPVLISEGAVICGAATICEYLLETQQTSSGLAQLPSSARDKAEARRLVEWSGGVFWREAVAPALSERFLKSYFGGAAPDSGLLRAAAESARTRLDQVGALIEARGWLAGERLCLADFALAAQISVLDYLGAWPFRAGDAEDPARDWYAILKSRPAFRGLLADRSPRLPPSEAYQDLDF